MPQAKQSDKKRNPGKSTRSSKGKGTSKSAKNNGGVWQRWQAVWGGVKDRQHGERIAFVIGAVSLAFAIYLSIACLSYLLVGHRDQDIVENLTTWQAMTNSLPQGEDAPVVQIQNVTRIYGAYASHQLMDQFLGFGSWMLIVFVIIIASRLMRITNQRWMTVVKQFVYTVLLGLWLSLTLAGVQRLLGLPTFFRWGGAHGESWINALVPAISWVGVFLIVIVSATIIGVLIRYEYMAMVRKVLGGAWIKKPESGFLRTKHREIFDDDLDSDTAEVSIDPKEVAEIEDDDEFDDDPEEVDNPDDEEELEPDPDDEDEDLKVTIATGDKDSQPSRQASNPRSLAGYEMPSTDLLADIDESAQEADMEEINQVKALIMEKLRHFRIGVEPVEVTVGPTVTLYEFKLDPGVKITRIRSLEEDIALSVESVGGVRIIAPIPGKGTIGIEVPNRNPRTVGMKALLNSRKFIETTQKLPIAIGRTITNAVHLFDLTKMPHLLIAGATGQGKSVGLNVLITSLLYSKQPEELKLILIDPKMLEFSVYENIGRHYLTKLPDEKKYIITDTNKALPVLESLCVEMDNRYALLTRAQVRNIADYNRKFRHGELSTDDGFVFLPYLVLIVDEFADLIMTTGKAIEKPIARLAQKARAAGIHLVLATQRPSTDVITGLIKANFPARMAFKVSSSIDSRTILDVTSAKNLVGRGDLLLNDGKEILRIQSAFIDTPETQLIIDHIASQPYPTEQHLLPEPPAEGSMAGSGGEFGEISSRSLDPLFSEVAMHVVQMQQGSTSNIQRRFNIGYNRAGRLMDQLEQMGLVSAQDGSKPRQVLVSDERTLQQILDSIQES